MFGISHEYDSAGKDLGRESRTAVYCAAPPSFKAKMVAEILAQVNAFFADHEHLLTEGQRSHFNNELCGVERDIREAEEKLLRLRQTALNLQAHLDAVG